MLEIAKASTAEVGREAEVEPWGRRGLDAGMPVSGKWKEALPYK